LRYDSTFSTAPVSIATGLSNPADIFVNVVDNVLGIPNSSNNTVTFINLSLGTDYFEKDWLKSINVTPNPIVSQATLSFQLNYSMKIAAEIVNIEGKIVQTIDFNDKTLQNGTVNINVSSLNSGVYYLVFKADKNSKTIPLLVE
jgi:Secretion system C-terminal sorting domain